MATFNSDVYQADQAVRAPATQGDVVCIMGSVDVTDALADNDIVKFFRKPRNTRVSSFSIRTTALASTNLAAKIGTTADDDQYYATAAFGQTAQTKTEADAPVAFWSTDAITTEEDVQLEVTTTGGTPVAGTIYFIFHLSQIQTINDPTPSVNPLPTQLT